MNSFLFSFFETTKAFFYYKKKIPEHAPYVHDPIDIKRIMILVVLALLPATFFAILSSGMQAILYETVNTEMMKQYLVSSTSISSYAHFTLLYFFPFFYRGLQLFVPHLILIYFVGSLIEIFFASLHRKTVSEGFFVTGILFTLIIPPTLPYWMTIFGVSVGLILGKEIFGGTGMNIFNPALICRCILYFSFPSYMSGNIWVGANQFKVANNVAAYNQKLNTDIYDTISTATPLNIIEIPNSISRLQVDGAALGFTKNVILKEELKTKLATFDKTLSFDKLSTTHIINFLTKGLSLPSDQIQTAVNFAKLIYNKPPYTNTNLFFGNMPGSFGEVSKFGILLGALFMLLTGIISFRIIIPAFLAALGTASLFYLYSLSGPDAPAHFFIPPYKQLLMGGLSFGYIFMATDPVSAPTTKFAQISYGMIIGLMTIIIRLVNPAFPEGVMLAILFANSFSAILDRISLLTQKRKICGTVTLEKIDS